MISADDLYRAFIEAGDTGLLIGDINRLHKTDPDRAKILPTERAAAGRHLKALLDAEAIEAVAHGRWRAIAGPDWAPGDPVPARLSRPVPQARPGVDLPVEQHRALTRRGPYNKTRPEEPPPAPPALDVDLSLLPYATPEESLAIRLYLAQHYENDWRIWVPSVFPVVAEQPFGPHHEEFWDYIDSIEPKVAAPPWISCWSRGHAKSSSCEMAVIRLGVRRIRKYCVYVCSEQDLADQHIDSIGSMLDGDIIRALYPDFADRAVGKYGNSKGWRRNRLHTKAGLVIDALGLDVAARGRRIDEQRPDLFCIDDIDGHADTPRTVERKIQELSRKLLPAGSKDVTVFFVQNKVHANSVCSRLVSRGGPGEPPPADFLANRIVSGPIPAIWNFQWAEHVNEAGAIKYTITGGEPSWDGMPLDVCQTQLDTFGINGFLAEFQHDEPDLSGGMFTHLDFTDHGPIRVSENDLPALIRLCAWVDPAVSKTDQSDACGVTVAALGSDRRYYFLWAWEQRATPTEALTVAARAAIEYGCEVLGVETDQGGDTWKDIYHQVMNKIVDEMTRQHGGQLPSDVRIPRFEAAKAGSTQMSKTERLQLLVSEYNLGRVRHVEGGAHVLERGLKRFPLYPPFDVADSAWHSWHWLATKAGGNPLLGGRTRTRAPRGVLPQPSPSSLPGAR